MIKNINRTHTHLFHNPMKYSLILIICLLVSITPARALENGGVEDGFSSPINDGYGVESVVGNNSLSEGVESLYDPVPVKGDDLFVGDKTGKSEKLVEKFSTITLTDVLTGVVIIAAILLILYTGYKVIRWIYPAKAAIATPKSVSSSELILFFPEESDLIVVPAKNVPVKITRTPHLMTDHPPERMVIDPEIKVLESQPAATGLVEEFKTSTNIMDPIIQEDKSLQWLEQEIPTKEIKKINSPTLKIDTERTVQINNRINQPRQKYNPYTKKWVWVNL